MHQFYVEIFNKVRANVWKTLDNNYIITYEAVVSGEWRTLINCFTVRILQYRLLVRILVFAYFFLALCNIDSLATIAHVRPRSILTWLRGFLVIFLYLVWFSLCSTLFGITGQWTMESWKIRLRGVSGSLLSSDLAKRVHVRASVEQQSCETRERRVTAREASPVSRLQPCVWSFSCLAPFAWRTEKKEKLVVVYEKLAVLSLKPRIHVRILIYQTWAIGYSKVAR